MEEKIQYKFFIDDSGTKELKDDKGIIFCYAGILIKNEDIAQFNKVLSEGKRKYFNGYEPELKSNWFRIPEERSKKYLRPYSISATDLDSFIQKLYKWVAKQPVRIIGSVVNKTWLLETYGSKAFNPSPTSYEYLLQRIANCATQLQMGPRSLAIIVDDMDGKTQSGNEWKTLLVKKHTQLLKGHSPSYNQWPKRKMDFKAIREEITFLDSKECNLIQIADLVAYNIMRQARDFWGNFDHPPFYAYYEKLLPIIHRDPARNKIGKYGVVCRPAVNELKGLKNANSFTDKRAVRSR